MTGYLVNFAIYTMAMLGLIFFALMVYKKFAIGAIPMKQSRNRKLCVEETLSLAPRKNLYIVKAGNERFLIAGDIDKTTLISKLEQNSTMSEDIDNDSWSNREIKVSKEIQPNRYQTTDYTNTVEDLPSIYTTQTRRDQNSNVLHDMLKKINR